MKNGRLVNFLVVQYLLSVSVPAFIGLFYTVKPIKKAVISFLECHNFYDLLKKNEVLIVIVFCIIIPFLITLYHYKKQKPYIDKDYIDLQWLLRYVDDILEQEANCYYQYPQLGKEFIKYIRPDIQLLEIKKSLTAYFREIYSDATILTDLFSVKDNKFKYEYNDEPTQTSIEVVNKPESTASTALKRKRIVTVSDTTKKRANFVHDNARDIKSIICFPVIEKSCVVYMISVSSLNKDVFNKNNEIKNKYALDIFAKRIKLQMYIKKIKGSSL